MQRFPPFDPPEYVSWKPDPALVRAYRVTLEADPERAAVVSALSPDAKLALYAGLLRARLHDIQLQRWVRTGVISKAWLGTGEEGTTVGPVHALERGSDVVAPMIRNAAACCELGMPIADMLRAYLATDDSPSRRRDLHVGARTHGVPPVRTPTPCWPPRPPPAPGPPAAARAGAPPCSLPRRSAGAGTRRTTSTRRGRRSPPRCSRPGASATPSACTRNT